MTPAVWVLCLLGLVAAAPPAEVSKQADKDFLQKQQDVLQFFDNVQQPRCTDRQRQAAAAFNFEKQKQKSNNPNAVVKLQVFFEWDENFLLQKGEAFNYRNSRHLRQAIYLFDVFYFAKDYDTFFEAASWALRNFNEGVYTYALAVAVLNRPDLKGVAIPRPSEIYTSLYVPAKALQKAYAYKQIGQSAATIYTSNGTQQYKYFSQYPKATVFYYNEDVDLNQNFAFEQLKNPAWFSRTKYQTQVKQSSQNNGENFYFYLRQLLNRYNLERYANGIAPVEPLRFTKPIKVGYYPQVLYTNGEPLSVRADNADINDADAEALEEFYALERRISDAIDGGSAFNVDGSKIKISASNGVEVLGNIIQSNGESVNKKYYSVGDGKYGYVEACRRVVGSLSNNYKAAHTNTPSAIEDDNTANRDTAFYQCVARALQLFRRHKKQLKYYNEEQLDFPGVKVSGFQTDKLVTYFDYSEVNLYNAINYAKDEEQQNYNYKVKQVQLNYKPFNYQVQVESDKNVDAVVRVFIGPRFDPAGYKYSMEDYAANVVEIDRFVAKLNNGQNKLKRNSAQSPWFTQLPKPAVALFPEVRAAISGGSAFNYDPSVNQRRATLPQNLLLPKGSEAGEGYVFSVIVTPFQDGQVNENGVPDDGKPEGFPFDRTLDHYYTPYSPNLQTYTQYIYHKNQEDLNQAEV